MREQDPGSIPGGSTHGTARRFPHRRAVPISVAKTQSASLPTPLYVDYTHTASVCLSYERIFHATSEKRRFRYHGHKTVIPGSTWLTAHPLASAIDIGVNDAHGRSRRVRWRYSTPSPPHKHPWGTVAQVSTPHEHRGGGGVCVNEIGPGHDDTRKSSHDHTERNTGSIPTPTGCSHIPSGKRDRNRFRHRSTSITFIRQAFAYRMNVFFMRRRKNGVFDATVTKP